MKALGQFIQSAILNVILSFMVNQIKMVLEVVARMINNLFAMNIEIISDGLQIEDKKLLILKRDLGIFLQIGDFAIGISDILNPTIETLETLSVSPYLIASSVIHAAIKLASRTGRLDPTNSIPFITAHIEHIIYQSIVFLTIKNQFADLTDEEKFSTRLYYFVSALGSLATGLMKIGRTTTADFNGFNGLVTASSNRPPSTGWRSTVRKIATGLGIANILLSLPGFESDDPFSISALIIHLVSDTIDLIPDHVLGQRYEQQLLKAIPE